MANIQMLYVQMANHSGTIMKTFLALFLAGLCVVSDVPRPNPAIKAAKSTVQIKIKIREITPEEGQKPRTGWDGCSGVYIKKDHILTANHCIDVPENAKIVEIWIKRWDGTTCKTSILRFDAERDLALLGVSKPGIPLSLAQSRALGEDIWVIGSPLGMPLLVTKGIISRLNLVFQGEKTKHFVIDAIVLPGNSGGPVINSRGQLVGILVRSTSALGSLGAAGLGFSVELSELREFLK
jgi:S1-C subfamily serine protease